MRRVLIALALFTAAVVRAQSSCPTQAPRPFSTYLLACEASSPCVAGTPSALRLAPIIPDCPAPPPEIPPPPSCFIYQLQSCDNVTWNFGDGTAPVTYSGTAGLTPTHTYAASGSYQPTVTVSNSLGSVQLGVIGTAIVASNPPTYVDFSPTNVTVPETAGNVTFTLVRSGNLATTAKVHYNHAEGYGQPRNQGEAIGGDVTFNPGETTKTFSFKIFDDHAYTGTMSDSVIASAADGTIVRTGGASYTLTEVDPQPSASAADARVAEGTAARNFAEVVVTLSAPIGVDANLVAVASDGTATFLRDYGASYAYCYLPAFATQCVARFPIENDDVPEPDETFTVTLLKPSGVGPSFARGTATVTIVNDDAAITPPSIRIASGAQLSLKLDIGQAPSSPLTIPLQSSSPDVVQVPASVAIGPGQRTATFAAHATRAGLARITASVPGTNNPSSLITVADALTIVADPQAITLPAGSDGSVSVSVQPPNGIALNVGVSSSNTDVAAAPESLTIPPGGNATLTIHALKRGTALISIVTPDGLIFPIAVTVVPPRRHAAR